MSAAVPRGARVFRVSLARRVAPCPRCGVPAPRHSTVERRLRETGVSGPAFLVLTVSVHRCEGCRRHFTVSRDHIAVKRGEYTNRVRRLAVDLVVRDGLTLEAASARMRRERHVRVPVTTLHGWVRDADREG